MLEKKNDDQELCYWSLMIREINDGQDKATDERLFNIISQIIDNQPTSNDIDRRYSVVRKQLEWKD